MYPGHRGVICTCLVLLPRSHKQEVAEIGDLEAWMCLTEMFFLGGGGWARNVFKNPFNFQHLKTGRLHVRSRFLALLKKFRAGSAEYVFPHSNNQLEVSSSCPWLKGCVYQFATSPTAPSGDCCPG